jgi:hypothetical protein
VNDHPGLVVRRSSTVESLVTFHGFKWLALPRCAIAGRLDVVVGIQQDRRIAGCGISTRKHRGLTVPGGIGKRFANHLNVLENSQPANSLGHELGGTTNFLRRKPVPRNTRNSN